MPLCFFTSDLHGSVDRYQKLFDAIAERKPDVVFLGGDLLPNYHNSGSYTNFLEEIIGSGLEELKERMGSAYPIVIAILGNDDPRVEEEGVKEIEERGLWEYVHNRGHRIGQYHVYGYNIVPPTPFLGKDWERYDVSRYIPPGCVSPEEGYRSVPVADREIRYTTITQDLQKLVGDADLSQSVLLLHSPPFNTNLDRIDADGKMIDYVPLDVNVGSIAIRRFIEDRRPLISLHGHIHESARLTGSWQDRLGKTYVFGAAHDGPELCLIQFSLEDLEAAERLLI